MSALENFYKTEMKIFKKMETNEWIIQTMFFSSILIIIIMILYARLFASVDFKNWEIQKCNPKYIFYSGYIKNNSNTDALTSTVDNFNECIVKFNSQSDNTFSKLLEKQMTEDLENNEKKIQDYNTLSREKLLKYQQQMDSKNKEFQIKIDHIQNLGETTGLQEELRKLNDVIHDIKEYAHSYLTYAMTHFVFKLKIAEENELRDNSQYSCSSITDISLCNTDNDCLVDNTNQCVNKIDFYKEQAININDLIKKYFSNNKL